MFETIVFYIFIGILFALVYQLFISLNKLRETHARAIQTLGSRHDTLFSFWKTSSKRLATLEQKEAELARQIRMVDESIQLTDRSVSQLDESLDLTDEALTLILAHFNIEIIGNDAGGQMTIRKKSKGIKKVGR